MIKYRLLFISSYLLLIQSAFGQSNQQLIPLDSVVQKLGDQFMKNPEAVGLSIGVYSNGKSHFYHFGTLQKGYDRPPNQYSLYEIASITKTFASYLLAKAAIEKRVNLSDDIRKYIKDDYPNLEFNGQPIRLVNLANTSSGLPDWIPAPPDSTPVLTSATYGGYKRKDFFTALHKVKLDTIPGSRLRHSNGAAQLLAYILEDVYKMPFEKLVQRYILTPYGMGNTFFTIPDNKYGQLAKGYDNKGNETLPEFTTSYLRGVAGLKSCAADLVKYIQLQLDTQNEISKLCQQRTVDADVSTGRSVGLLPDSLLSDRVYSTGLNWTLYQPAKGSTQIFTDGGSHGFCSYIIFYREMNSGIVILTNKSDEATFRSLRDIPYQIALAMGKK